MKVHTYTVLCDYSQVVQIVIIDYYLMHDAWRNHVNEELKQCAFKSLLFPEARFSPYVYIYVHSLVNILNVC